MLPALSKAANSNRGSSGYRSNRLRRHWRSLRFKEEFSVCKLILTAVVLLTPNFFAFAAPIPIRTISRATINTPTIR